MGHLGLGIKVNLQKGGRGFLPSDIATNQELWLRSDLGITTSVYDATTVVSEWIDQFNGVIYEQSVGADRGTYVLNTLNGRPSLQFDGVSEWMVRQTGGHSLTSYTFFVVAYAGIGETDFIIGSSDSNRDYITCINGSMTVRTSVTLITHIWAYGSGYSIFECTDNNSVNNAWKDGVAAGTNPQVTPGQLDWDQLFRYRIASAFGSGNILELIFYSRVLSSAERTLVRKYLGSRYGITI